MIRLNAVEASPRGAAPRARATVGPVDLAIERGERVLILGGNGAGKTTLLRALAGFIAPSAGTVAWTWPGGATMSSPGGSRRDGESVTLWPHLAALFEAPDPQFLAETVRADVAFGLEGLDLTREAVAERVEATLGSFGLAAFADRNPLTLSAGEKARALLAAALAARPQCLLLDQTLAHLDPGSRRAHEARLAREAESGAFTLVRTHHEAEAPFPGERLLILEDGRLTDARQYGGAAVRAARSLPLPLALRVSAALEGRGLWRGPLTLDTPELLAELSQLAAGEGAAHGATHATEHGSAPARRRAAGEDAFSLQSVRWGPPGAPALFESLDLAGARGEIVALVGRSGSGKSSLLRLAGGFETPATGVAWRAGTNRRGGDSNGAALALEYPERQLVGRTVLEDVAMALWVRGAKRPERERMAVRALAAVGMTHERFGGRVPSTLSEGEKRRVALAGLIAEPADLLLLDEPTAGLDPEGRRALRQTLDALRARERTIVVASHDLDFVHAVADRVVVLAREEGGPARIVREGGPAEIFRDAASLGEAGLPAPDVVTLEDALRAAGILAPAVPNARDADALVDAVERLSGGAAAAGDAMPRPADARAGAA